VDEGGVGRTANDVGPIRWMSPEALRDRIFSEKSDVWAFGCLMVEMFTQGKAPFEELDLFRVAVMVRDEGHAPPIPPLAPDWARQLMEGCFQRQPEQRPRFQEICDLL
jgi:Bruton agammaglobulinemia tyrosine kinase